MRATFEITTRRTLGAVLILAVAAILTLALVSAGAGADQSADQAPKLGVFETAPGPDDNLPDIVANGFARDAGGKMGDGRWAGSFEGQTHYMIPTVAGQLCVVSVDAQLGVAGGACVNNEQLAKGVAVTSLASDGSLATAIIVPDGYQAPDFTGVEPIVQTAPRRNVAFAKTPAGETAHVRMSGPDGTPDAKFTVGGRDN